MRRRARSTLGPRETSKRRYEESARNSSEPTTLPPTPTHRRFACWFWSLTVAGILSAGVVFRLVDLDRIPGINGDEAWFGVQVTDALAGRPFFWHTPNGNPLSPFHAGVLFLLHLLHPAPAFWLLRVPAVAAGLLLVGLAYPLLRKPLGVLTAVLITLLFASLPVNIIYGRIGWDPSQSACAVFIALGLVLRRRYLWAGLAFLAALLVHPSNVFAALPLLGPVVADLALWLVQQPAPKRRRVRRWMTFGTLAFVLSGVAVLQVLAPEWAAKLWAAVGRRAVDPGAAIDFAVAFGRLFSGVTSYRYVVGSVPSSFVWLSDATFWLAVPIVAALGVRQMVRQRDWRGLGLAAGLVAGLVAFYLVAGPAAISPHHERYALFCVAPAVVLFAMLASTLGSSAGRRGWTLDGVVLLCAALLTGFHCRYFQTFERTGGTSHETYWVGPAEMKKDAFNMVAKATGNATVTLVCESWWLYWPLRYLAAGQGRVRVVGVKGIEGAEHLMPTESRDQLLAVGFVGGPFERRLGNQGSGLEAWSIANSAGRDALRVWRLPRSTIRPRAE